MDSGFAVGDTVFVGSGSERIGKIAFIGETKFAAGEWVGVVLTSPLGKNDGSVNGVSYFQCKPMHGIFSKPQNLRHASATESNMVNKSTPEGDQSGDTLPRRFTGSSIPPRPNSSLVGQQDNESAKPSFKLGDRVQISGGRIGILRYLGTTEFAAGEWAGIELDEPLGKNDGSVNGKRYFSCKPNFGIFATVNKLRIPGSQLRRSQESLLSYCSNLSSVSRSYRAQCAPPPTQSHLNSSAPRRPPSTVCSPDQSKDQTASLQSLQRLVREKEQHISQLLEERDLERSDLARITVDREQAYTQLKSQQAELERLNMVIQNVSAANRMLQEENEQLASRLHEEKKTLEDLQFRMEEENINKATLESVNADDESKIFELEEALLVARVKNERVEAELAHAREEINKLITGKLTAPVSNESKATAMDVTHTVSAVQTGESGSSCMQKSTQTLLKANELEEALDRVVPDTKDAKVGSPSKSSLHQVNLVSQTSVPPSPTSGELSYHTEIERLRRELADREKITESALKRQVDVLETVSADYEKQLADLNAQLSTASKELLASRKECSDLKDTISATTATFESTISELKKQLSEADAKSSEKLICYTNRISDLTSELDKVKSKTSSTVMEQALAIRKLEEKLQATERQLLELQSGPTNQGDANEDNDVMNQLRTRLRELEEENGTQLEKLTSLQRERDDALHRNEEATHKMTQLDILLATTQSDLTDSLRKQEELARSLETARLIQEQLRREFCGLLGDDSADVNGSLESLWDVVRTRINLLSNTIEESDSRRVQLETRIAELESERANLENQLSSRIPSNELTEARETISSLEASVANALENVKAKTTELQLLQGQLDRTLSEHMALKESHANAVQTLEKEKQNLLQRIQAMEANAQNHADSADKATSERIANLLQEKETSDFQINLLNTIVADLHKKNEDLEQRIRSQQCHLNGSPKLSNTREPSAPRPPRLWCDHCLVFDTHNTELCPSRPDHGPQLPKHKLSFLATPTSQRVYCDICGIFDQHITAECTNNDTF